MIEQSFANGTPRKAAADAPASGRLYAYGITMAPCKRVSAVHMDFARLNSAVLAMKMDDKYIFAE